jgi:hypothetical protein
MSTQKQKSNTSIKIKIGDTEIEGNSNNKLVANAVNKANKRATLLLYFKWGYRILIVVLLVVGVINPFTGGVLVLPTELKDLMVFIKKVFSG